MATPTTVLEFAQNTFDATTAARTAAQTAMTAAQGEVSSARDQRDLVQASYKEKQSELDEKRDEIAEADTPAEVTALAAELATLIAEYRSLQGDLLDARDSVADATHASERASSEYSRLRGRGGVAEGELASALLAQETLDALKDAATQEPLDTIAAEAGDALTDVPYTVAEGIITDAIPERLLAAARRGFEVQTARAARLREARRSAEALLMDELEASRGVEGLVLRREFELDRAEANLREWTDTAETRFNRALTKLEWVSDSEFLLAPTELDGVQALDATAGQDAADLRIALFDAALAEEDASLDLELATQAALAPDPTADVSGETSVSEAQTLFETAEDAIEAAQLAFDADRAEFVAWTAEVPDVAWKKVLAFVEAEAALIELRDMEATDVTELVDAVTEAEANLAEALDAAESHRRTLAFLENYVRAVGDRLTRSGATHPEHLLGAVRGDD